MNGQHPNPKRADPAWGLWKAVRSFVLANGGAALVEFTLFAPLLVLSSVYTMDFGLYFLHQIQAQNAAQAAIQYAIVTGSSPPFSSIDQFTINTSTGPYCPSTSSPYLTSVASNATCSDGSIAGNYVGVATTKTYSTLVPFGYFSSGTYTVTGQAWVRVQ
jgi:Flp pilus assembly protein TadG